MSLVARTLALAAVFAASAAFAQADPHAGHHPEGAPPAAKPADPGPEAKSGCGMMHDHMMKGAKAGPGMGGEKGKDAPATKGMKGRAGMDCMAQAQAQPDHGRHAAPKAQ